jgi:hypothetical protein
LPIVDQRTSALRPSMEPADQVVGSVEPDLPAVLSRRVLVSQDEHLPDARRQDQRGHVPGGQRGPRRRHAVEQGMGGKGVLDAFGDDQLGALGPEQAGGVVLDQAEARGARSGRSSPAGCARCRRCGRWRDR